MRHHGIHHVTAIAGPARRNLDFYTRVLGLRLVKKTVNFDDPGTYHFYFGDSHGSPGSILTFFPWEHVAPGRNGVGSTSETAFRVPEGSLGYWTHRFIEQGVEHGALEKRFGQSVLTFKDPHGTSLSLVGVADASSDGVWTESDVPAEHAIRGLEGVTLLVENGEPTGAILTDIFGFSEVAREGSLVRYKSDAAIGSVVDIRSVGGFLPGRMGGGSVHHVAFRSADDADQAEMVRKLAENHGLHPTEQKDRNYFRSVYFREPNGILFEIATDEPGFAVDEAEDHLGSELKLPAFLEPRRSSIETHLPELA
ncbi:ring-cleaving dioxygenase [Microvirga sp. ACRRW]|uniref:ring-cleaving dioxygenase n=1 Tax=Microvirga sp. ACRRW TaxID=2918205 RepID=UPI001EF4A07E|nr:ring-cleaving dioxygenase [Microvirga sp. ACRRW]MCG7394761.1 ring-cleaving dioxygenase [Microvirga sp. ACRRW]